MGAHICMQSARLEEGMICEKMLTEIPLEIADKSFLASPSVVAIFQSVDTQYEPLRSHC